MENLPKPLSKKASIILWGAVLLVLIASIFISSKYAFKYLNDTKLLKQEEAYQSIIETVNIEFEESISEKVITLEELEGSTAIIEAALKEDPQNGWPLLMQLKLFSSYAVVYDNQSGQLILTDIEAAESLFVILEKLIKYESIQAPYGKKLKAYLDKVDNGYQKLLLNYFFIDESGFKHLGSIRWFTRFYLSYGEPDESHLTDRVSKLLIFQTLLIKNCSNYLDYLIIKGSLSQTLSHLKGLKNSSFDEEIKYYSKLDKYLPKRIDDYNKMDEEKMSILAAISLSYLPTNNLNEITSQMSINRHLEYTFFDKIFYVAISGVIQILLILNTFILVRWKFMNSSDKAWFILIDRKSLITALSVCVVCLSLHTFFIHYLPKREIGVGYHLFPFLVDKYLLLCLGIVIPFIIILRGIKAKFNTFEEFEAPEYFSLTRRIVFMILFLIPIFFITVKIEADNKYEFLLFLYSFLIVPIILSLFLVTKYLRCLLWRKGYLWCYNMSLYCLIFFSFVSFLISFMCLPIKKSQEQKLYLKEQLVKIRTDDGYICSFAESTGLQLFRNKMKVFDDAKIADPTVINDTDNEPYKLTIPDNMIEEYKKVKQRP